MIKKIFLFLLALSFVGCLKTRNNVGQSSYQQTVQSQTVDMQNTEAASNYEKNSESQEQMRELVGRIEVLENKIKTDEQSKQNEVKSQSQSQEDLVKKVSLLQEAMIHLQNEISELKANPNSASEKSAEIRANSKKADIFLVAQKNFADRDWKKAILNFQKYRDENPQGKNYADATYKIGVSFQELGMPEEAKTFFEEAANKYAKTEAGKKSSQRLKSIKK